MSVISSLARRLYQHNSVYTTYVSYWQVMRVFTNTEPFIWIPEIEKIQKSGYFSKWQGQVFKVQVFYTCTGRLRILDTIYHLHGAPHGKQRLQDMYINDVYTKRKARHVTRMWIKPGYYDTGLCPGD